MKYNKLFFGKQQQGFALLGASLIIVVAALTILGTLNQRNLDFKNTNYSSAQQRLNQVNTALVSYAMAKGYWPCPASLLDASTASTFGDEQRTNGTTCTTGTGVDSLIGDTVYHGMVPIKTLGLDKEFAADIWSNKLEYYITKDVVGDFNQAGIISVISPMGASITTPYIIISRGANGYGGYIVNGNTQNALPPISNTNELQNLVGNDFIITSQDNFDDIIMYLANSSVAAQNTSYNQ